MGKEKLNAEEKKLEMLEAELDMVVNRQDWAKIELEGFIGMDMSMAAMSKSAEEESPSVSKHIQKLIERSEEVGRVRAKVEKQRKKVDRLRELYGLESE